MEKNRDVLTANQIPDQIRFAIDDALSRTRILLDILGFLTNQGTMLNEYGLEVPPHMQAQYDEYAHRLESILLSVRSDVAEIRSVRDALLDLYQVPGEIAGENKGS